MHTGKKLVQSQHRPENIQSCTEEDTDKDIYYCIKTCESSSSSSSSSSSFEHKANDSLLPIPSQYKISILAYIGGYIIRVLSKSLLCKSCCLAFEKDQCGLLYSSENVLNICEPVKSCSKLLSMAKIFRTLK